MEVKEIIRTLCAIHAEFNEEEKIKKAKRLLASLEGATLDDVAAYRTKFFLDGWVAGYGCTTSVELACFTEGLAAGAGLLTKDLR